MSIKELSLKKKVFFLRFNMLFSKALKEGRITRFDDAIFEKMGNTIVACLPVSLYIKHSNYLFLQGTCFERSLYMFLALEDAVLVRGNNKDLEYNYGKGHEGHGWVEVGNFVYDPSLMLKFEKYTYYSLYGCTNVTKIDKQTYLSEHKEFIDSYVSHDYDEFRPGGKRRLELLPLIVQLQELSKILKDEEFTKDLNVYLSYIDFDEKQILDEKEANWKTLITNK